MRKTEDEEELRREQRSTESIIKIDTLLPSESSEHSSQVNVSDGDSIKEPEAGIAD